MNALRALSLPRFKGGASLFPEKFSAGINALRNQAHDTINIHSASPSYSMLSAQIIWFGVGLTLFSDTAEKIFNCPHLVVVALSAMLMIASAWFSLRALLALCLVTLPCVISMMYFSVGEAVPGSEPLALWTQMLSMKSLEYTSGLLIMMGYYIRPVSMTPDVNVKKFSAAKVLAALGFLLGNGIIIYSSMKVSMADSEVSFATALAEQGSTILGLLLLGFSARSANAQRISQLGSLISQFTQLPVRGLMLVVGMLCAIFTDWYSQYLYGWMYYASTLIPPLAMIVMTRFFFRKPAASSATHLNEI